MADPFRLKVQKALTAALGEITVLNGYVNDLEGKIFRGRQYFGEDTEVPFISILEEPIAPENDFEGTDGEAGTSTYALMVQGFAEDDKQNPTDTAHVLLADVKKRLAGIKIASRDTDRVLGFPDIAPTVTTINFGGGVVRPADDISAVAYFWLRVSMELVEDHDDPYA
jgi:hypothetical protein